MSDFDTTIEMCEVGHTYAKLKRRDEVDWWKQGCPFCLKEGLIRAREELINERVKND